jgi:hypothetical protein
LKRLTLSGFFALAIAAVAVVVAAAMALLLARSRQTLLHEADKLQLAASERVEAQVVDELGRASRALDDIARGITTGVAPIGDPAALEAPLLLRLLGDAHLEELTFTRASLLGYDAEGEARLAPEGRYQLTLRRTPDGTYTTRLVTPAAPSAPDRKSTRLNSSHNPASRMPSSA